MNTLSYLNVESAGFLLKLCEWQFLALFWTGGYEHQQLNVKHWRAAKAPQASSWPFRFGQVGRPSPQDLSIVRQRSMCLFSLWPGQCQREGAVSWANLKQVRSFWGLFNPWKVGSIWEICIPIQNKDQSLTGPKVLTKEESPEILSGLSVREELKCKC